MAAVKTESATVKNAANAVKNAAKDANAAVVLFDAAVNADLNPDANLFAKPDAGKSAVKNVAMTVVRTVAAAAVFLKTPKSVNQSHKKLPFVLRQFFVEIVI